MNKHRSWILSGVSRIGRVSYTQSSLRESVSHEEVQTLHQKNDYTRFVLTDMLREAEVRSLLDTICLPSLGHVHCTCLPCHYTLFKMHTDVRSHEYCASPRELHFFAHDFTHALVRCVPSCTPSPCPRVSPLTPPCSFVPPCTSPGAARLRLCYRVPHACQLCGFATQNSFFYARISTRTSHK